MFSLFLQPPSQLYGSLRQPDPYFASMFSDNAKICNPWKGKKRHKTQKEPKNPQRQSHPLAGSGTDQHWQTAISDLIGGLMIFVYTFRACTLHRMAMLWMLVLCQFLDPFFFLPLQTIDMVDQYFTSGFLLQEFLIIQSKDTTSFIFFWEFCRCTKQTHYSDTLWYYCFRVNNIYTVWE